MSEFDILKPVIPSGMGKVLKKYNADTSDKKIDLASGVYLHYDGKPWVLPSVALAEKEIHDEQAIIPDYGFPNSNVFTKLATQLLLGRDNPALRDERVHSTQTMSGTSALRIGAEFLTSLMGKTIYYYSDPTWDTQVRAFNNAGFREARKYRYWCPETHDLDFSGLLEDLKNAPEGAVILLHASAHNPTGIDLTNNQWKQIALVMRERKLFPFFDSAFQGLAKNLEDDVWAVRYFVEQGFEMICVQSFSKNCGLYGERIGNLFVVTNSKQAKSVVASNMSPITSGMYLMPSAYPNRILARLWSKPEFKEQWIEDLETIRIRVEEARQQLRTSLERLGTPGDWSFITKQIGVASWTGLNESQVDMLADKYHVYLLTNGRANFSAITESNANYIAKAIHEVLT